MAEHDRTALSCFVFSAVLSGANAVGIRFSNRELSPLWGAGLRFWLAAAVLFVFMIVMKLRFPSGRPLAGAALYGLIGFGLAFGLAYYGFVRVQAGLGQTLLALTPLATLLLAVLQRQERLRAAALVGTLLSVLGIAVMSREPLQAAVPLTSLLALVGSAICFGQASIVARRFPVPHPVVLNAVGLAVAAAVLSLAAVLAGDQITLPERGSTWLAVWYLAIVGSVLVFVLYAVVLRHWPASRASYVFVLVPFVTVLLSAWLDNEPIGLGLVLGGLLVLFGVYIGALRSATAGGGTGPRGRPTGETENDYGSQ